MEQRERAALAARLKLYARIRAAADPVTAYAKAVVARRIPAGPYVRSACKRHLTDLIEGPKRGLEWDLATAKRFIGFCAEVCKLNGGQWEGKPFLLTSWQCFVGGALFGWKRREPGDQRPVEELPRRFTTGYIETGKGSGKSPLAAAIGLYGLTSDNEARAEIYAAATKKDQAMVLFRDAVVMVDLSPELTHVLSKSGVGERTWNLAYRTTGSFFRPISSDDGQSGPRPHISLLDEIHEHKTNMMVELLKAGQKFRRQPLLLMITNSGVDKTSVCFQYHEHAVKVCSGALADDSFFGYVCALDKKEDPLKSEACWPKVNPSLEESNLPGLKYLRDQVNGARGMASKASLVRRLNFCQWVEALNPAIPRETWEACEDASFDVERLRGRACYGGLDLSSTTDLTAAAWLFEPTEDDPCWRLLVRFWIPRDELAEREDRDKVPYLAWVEAGHVIALPGRAIDKAAVAGKCAEDAAAYELQEMAFDRWRIEDFKRVLEDAGIDLPLVPHGQGFQSMSPAIDAFETMLVAGAAAKHGKPARHVEQEGASAEAEEKAQRLARMNKPLRVVPNPCLTWCAANLVFASDAAGNRKPDKKKATGRIDGLAATIMASGQASKRSGGGRSFWETQRSTSTPTPAKPETEAA